ncbi:MAG: ABC transporter permease, partial [Zoogloea sp.]
MNGLIMSWRMLRRDLRAGELGLLLLALVIAVASLSSVGFFTDRVGQGLKRQANQLLGGDLVLVSDHPIPADYISEARKQGLDWRESSTLPTMASHGEQFDLAA